MRHRTTLTSGPCMVLLLGLLLLIARQGPAVAQAGTYTTTRAVTGGQQTLSLLLNPDGTATLSVRSPGENTPVVYTGTWIMQSNGQIAVDVSRGSTAYSFVFNQSGNQLTTAVWNTSQWGSNALQFSRVTSRPTMAQLAGNYVMQRKVARGTMTTTLHLAANGDASLLVRSPGRRAARYDGTWSLPSPDTVQVNVRRGSTSYQFLLHIQGNALTATSWSRPAWGSTAPVFTRPSPTQTSSVRTYTATRTAASGSQQIVLRLWGSGQASMSVRNPGTSAPSALYTGTWTQLAGNRIRVNVTRGSTRYTFTFRQSGTNYVAVSWDRSAWGNTPLTFNFSTTASLF